MDCSGNISNEMENLTADLKKVQEEYDNLQAYVSEMELKQSITLSSVLDHTSRKDNSCSDFNHSLRKYVADLLNNPIQSDLTLLMEEGQVMYGHKLILLFRSSEWNGIDLNCLDCLDFSDMKYEAVYNMFKWVYTDELDTTNQENLIDMIQLASKFNLKTFFKRCEQALNSFVNETNYEVLYKIARKVSANELKDTCLKIKGEFCKQTSENLGEILHQCLDCYQTFMDAEELAEHSKSHSGASLDTNSEYPIDNDQNEETENETENFELNSSNTEESGEVAPTKNPIRTTKSRTAKSSKTSEKAAKTNEKAANTSEKAAKTSVKAAKTSEKAAKTSDKAAKSSEKAAKKTSDKAAKSSEKAAKTSDKAAKTSGKAAKTSEKSAKSSVKTAKSSETTAKSKKSTGKSPSKKSSEKKAEIFQNLKCSVCVKVFKTRRKLNSHEKTHKRDKIFSCDICGKHFYNMSHCKQHALVHSELRPFQCDVCGATFRQSGGLYSHRSIHTGDKPYKCNECDKSFRMKNCLLTHQRIHTGVKPYICHVCGKGFGSSSHFRRHKIIHTGEKRFQCEVCKKCFQYSHHLKRHLKTHSKVKPQPRQLKINRNMNLEIQYPVPSHKFAHNMELFHTFHINDSVRDAVQYITIEGGDDKQTNSLVS